MPARDALVEEFRAHSHRFADLLAHTDPESPCWTWGPSQTAGFVQRFQVQEAALHRWDAENAVGDPAPLGTEGAADAIVLFADILPMGLPDPEHAFDVEIVDHPDGRRTIEMLRKPGRPVAGTLRGPASDLLLVLWQRRPVTTVEVDGDGAAIQATIDAADFD
jgi:uncharacterized protein (TIGR03083 family)